jgi:hypothetical protein
LLTFLKNAVPLGLNEADTLKSSSILIFSLLEQSIYTPNGWHEARLIKRGNYSVAIGRGEVNVASLQVIDY